MLWELLFVFLATGVADFLWVQYVASITQRSPMLAAVWSSSIILANAGVVLVYVKNPWTIGAACLGAFGGTYISVRRTK
jgi:hypothetical protein